VSLSGEHQAAVRALLVRGLAAGLVAGLVGFMVARLVGVPALEGALAYEEAVSGSVGLPVIDRATQSGVGLALAYGLYGVAVGGILGLVHSAVVGRFGGLGGRGTAAVVALVAFVATVLVPFLKYPPNPPASTTEGTVGTRTAANLLLLAVSVLVAAGAVQLARRLSARTGWWYGVVIAASAYLAVVAATVVALPAVVEAPADFPAVVLYDFRIAALAAQAALWMAWALSFAALLPGTAYSLAQSGAGTRRQRGG
jgi:hypothetical protein